MKINLFTKFDQVRTHLTEWTGVALIRGVYFLCTGSRLIYIGSSNNIMLRIGSHFKDKVFDRAYFINMAGYDMDTIHGLEATLIDYFKPNLNGIHVNDNKINFFGIITHTPQMIAGFVDNYSAGRGFRMSKQGLPMMNVV